MVRFECGLDEQSVKDLNKHQIKKLWWIYLIFSLLFMGCGGIRLLERDFFIGIILVVFGALFTPLCILLTFVLQKSNNKAQAIISVQTKSVYTFDAVAVEVQTIKGDEFRERTWMKYSYLHKVEEGNAAYYLFTAKAQCLIVNKAGLAEGTLEELNALLSANLGNKFKKKG